MCAEGKVSIHHAEATSVYAGQLVQVGEAVQLRSLPVLDGLTPGGVLSFTEVLKAAIR